MDMLPMDQMLFPIRARGIQMDIEEPHTTSVQAKRILYLLDFLANQQMLSMMLPILKMGITAMPSQKLNCLLISLSGIVQAVSDLVLSQDEFDDKIEPHIRELMAVFPKFENLSYRTGVVPL